MSDDSHAPYFPAELPPTIGGMRGERAPPVDHASPERKVALPGRGTVAVQDGSGVSFAEAQRVTAVRPGGNRPSATAAGRTVIPILAAALAGAALWRWLRPRCPAEHG